MDSSARLCVGGPRPSASEVVLLRPWRMPWLPESGPPLELPLTLQPCCRPPPLLGAVPLPLLGASAEFLASCRTTKSQMW